MIPIEIVDHILGLLRSDWDYVSLERCSALFPQLIDRHLYSRITLISGTQNLKGLLDKGTYVVNCTKFSLVLIARPHVANYVVRVIVKFGFAASDSKLILPVFSSILSNLPRIESIALNGGLPLSWPTLDPEFCTAFRNSIRLPSIKEVVISNIDGFPLSTFDHCENLRRLQLNGGCTDGGDVPTSPYPRLSSLSVTRQPDYTKMVSWAKTNTIHTLSFLVYSRAEYPQFQNLIKACSTTLVKLELNHVLSTDVVNRRMPVFPELRLPVLDHIVFRSPIIVQNVRLHYSFFPLLVPFLTSIKRMSSLSPIHLTLHLQLRFLTRNALTNADWSTIAAILVLPIFRHPIELYINQLPVLGATFLSSFEQNSALKGLLNDGKLVIINEDEQSSLIPPAT